MPGPLYSSSCFECFRALTVVFCLQEGVLMNTSRFIIAFVVVFIDSGLFPLSDVFPVSDVFDIQDCISAKY